MIKTKQKWIVAYLILGVSMLLILSACSNNQSEDSANANASNSTVAPANNVGEEKRGEIKVSLYDRGTVPPEEGTMADNRWTRWINEKGPVDVNFVTVPRWESTQKFNVMFASKNAPDLIMEYDTGYRNQLYNQELIAPIDELVENNSTNYKQLLEKYPVLRKVGTKDDGKLYEFARFTGLQPNHALFIRKDWLDNLGLEAPKTTEDLFAVAKAFKENDPDQNGKNDTFGIGMSSVSGMIIDYMFGNVFTFADKQPWYPDQNGELVHDWERLEAATAYKKRLFDTGLVDKDFLTDAQGEKVKQDWINGKVGIYANGIGLYNDYEALMTNHPEAEVIVIPLPESEFGQFSPSLYNPAQSVAVVNASAKDPISVMKYIDFMLEAETEKIMKTGLEGENYELVNGCPKAITTDEAKAQRVYINDLLMIYSTSFEDPCSGWWNANKDNSTELLLKYTDIRFEASKAYVSKDRPTPAITHQEHMPLLPDEMQINQVNGFKAIEDIVTKSIISGESYSVEKAMADAQAAWNKSNGTKIDEWYANWYRNNKEQSFLREDMYELIDDVIYGK